MVSSLTHFDTDCMESDTGISFNILDCGALMSDHTQGYCQRHVKVSASKCPHQANAQILLYISTYPIDSVMLGSMYIGDYAHVALFSSVRSVCMCVEVT